MNQKTNEFYFVATEDLRYPTAPAKTLKKAQAMLEYSCAKFPDMKFKIFKVFQVPCYHFPRESKGGRGKMQFKGWHKPLIEGVEEADNFFEDYSGRVDLKFFLKPVTLQQSAEAV